MAKIKSGGWYVKGDLVLRVKGIQKPKNGNYEKDLYDIEYVGIHGVAIPSKLFARQIRTCTQITKEVADIVLATL